MDGLPRALESHCIDEIPNGVVHLHGTSVYFSRVTPPVVVETISSTHLPPALHQDLNLEKFTPRNPQNLKARGWR